MEKTHLTLENGLAGSPLYMACGPQTLVNSSRISILWFFLTKARVLGLQRADCEGATTEIGKLNIPGDSYSCSSKPGTNPSSHRAVIVFAGSLRSMYGLLADNSNPSVDCLWTLNVFFC